MFENLKRINKLTDSKTSSGIRETQVKVIPREEGSLINPQSLFSRVSLDFKRFRRNIEERRTKRDDKIQYVLFRLGNKTLEKTLPL